MLSTVDSHVDALCRQYPGVWPNFGEDMETVQGVHAARAGQESGRHALQFSRFGDKFDPPGLGGSAFHR